MGNRVRSQFRGPILAITRDLTHYNQASMRRRNCAVRALAHIDGERDDHDQGRTFEELLGDVRQETNKLRLDHLVAFPGLVRRKPGTFCALAHRSNRPLRPHSVVGRPARGSSPWFFARLLSPLVAGNARFSQSARSRASLATTKKARIRKRRLPAARRMAAPKRDDIPRRGDRRCTCGLAARAYVCHRTDSHRDGG